jgi:ABC-type uncharacterized transport system permease subunit
MTEHIKAQSNSRKLLQTTLRYGLMILLAFLLFAVILLITGKNPIQAYQDLFKATFGSAYGFSEVIVAMIPILLTALAVALPSRIGMINVGAEGQLFLGAIFATFAALAFKTWPAWILLPVMVLFGFLGGALWALLPAYFKSIGLVNETITTLLMNSIAPKIAGLLVFGYWHSPLETNMTPNFVQAAPHPPGVGLRPGFAGGFLVCHEKNSLGAGDAVDRRQPPGCPAQRYPGCNLYDPRVLHQRGDCRPGRHGPGFWVLRPAHSEFLSGIRLHGLFN